MRTLNFLAGRLFATVLLIALIVIFKGDPWAVAIGFLALVAIWVLARR